MLRPRTAGLPAELARAARELARVLGQAGHRAWLVGGAVRDLALGVVPGDIDLASAARPEELERLFPVTHAVGKAFGTVVVRSGGVDVQVTTFRSEAGYDDARRPTHVRFGTSLEEDAARRDFTCNALYLDPLQDELRDTTGGLDDLAARRLRCVGDPARRFAEDGLRLLRLGRLAAHYGLAVEPATAQAARGSLGALRGVSSERVLAECLRMAEGPAPARAVGLLQELGVLERLPGFAELERDSLPGRVRAMERAPAREAGAFFATLFRPADPAQEEACLARLAALRPPRALLARVQRMWGLERELDGCLAELARGEPRRSRWIRLVRSKEFDGALATWRAWHPAHRERELAELLRRAAELGPEERRPARLVTGAEVERAGIPRGPRWSQILHEAEDLQLDGEFATLEQARAWLARRARE